MVDYHTMKIISPYGKKTSSETREYKYLCIDYILFFSFNFV
jgi:hypothetical protein